MVIANPVCTVQFLPRPPPQEPQMMNYNIVRDYLILTAQANKCSWPIRNTHLLKRHNHFLLLALQEGSGNRCTFVFSLWVVSTCVLLCLVLLTDGFLSLIFYLQVFFVFTNRGPKQLQCFSANQAELGFGSEFSTLMILERVFYSRNLEGRDQWATFTAILCK